MHRETFSGFNKQHARTRISVGQPTEIHPLFLTFSRTKLGAKQQLFKGRVSLLTRLYSLLYTLGSSSIQMLA